MVNEIHMVDGTIALMPICLGDNLVNAMYKGTDMERLRFFKYTNGHAYYYAKLSAGEELNKITHLLSGEVFSVGSKICQIDEVTWSKIPKSFQLDAIANNPEIRKRYSKETTTMMEDTMDLGRFGQMKTDDVRMSPKGLAIKMVAKNGQTKYRAWDKEKNLMVDVTGITMPMQGMLFVMPCKKLEAGDIIDHEGEFVFVKEVATDGSMVLLGGNGELSEHIKTVSFMGFNFYRKVVTPMKRFGDGANGIMEMMKMQMMMGMMSGNNGNMSPLFMMQMFGNKTGDLFDFDSMFEMTDDISE